MSRVICVVGKRWTTDDIQYHSNGQRLRTETLRIFLHLSVLILITSVLVSNALRSIQLRAVLSNASGIMTSGFPP